MISNQGRHTQTPWLLKVPPTLVLPLAMMWVLAVAALWSWIAQELGVAPFLDPVPAAEDVPIEAGSPSQREPSLLGLIALALVALGPLALMLPPWVRAIRARGPLGEPPA